MKRLVIVLTIFSVMLGLSGAELAYTTHFYGKTHGLLSVALERFDAAPEQLDRAETVRAVEDAYEYWEKGKRCVMMLGNHNAVKFVDEKLTALRRLVVMNQKSDAYVTLATAMTYVEDLKTDNYPILPNLL